MNEGTNKLYGRKEIKYIHPQYMTLLLKRGTKGGLGLLEKREGAVVSCNTSAFVFDLTIKYLLLRNIIR